MMALATCFIFVISIYFTARSLSQGLTLESLLAKKAPLNYWSVSFLALKNGFLEAIIKLFFECLFKSRIVLLHSDHLFSTLSFPQSNSLDQDSLNFLT